MPPRSGGSSVAGKTNNIQHQAATLCIRQ